MGDAEALGTGTDDFHGLRDYQSSDSPRHIAWKAVARSRTNTPLTKLFSGRASSEMWFDYAGLPDNMDREARLSRLTRWVLLAAHTGAVMVRPEPFEAVDLELSALWAPGPGEPAQPV